MDSLLDRYMPEQQQVIQDYWETIRWTRSTGKISEGIKQREYEYWSKFDPDLVIQALRIHMERYPQIREDYTRGILRNRAKGGAAVGEHQRFTGNHHGKTQGKGKRDVSAADAFRRLTGI